MIPLDQIEKEIQRLNAEIETLEEERSRIENRILPMVQERDSWKKIYAVRNPESSPVEKLTPVSPEIRGDVPLPTNLYGAKSQKIQQYLANGGDATSRGIQRYMESVQMPVSLPFAYKSLAKFKEIQKNLKS